MSTSALRGPRIPKVAFVPKGFEDLSADEKQRFLEEFYASLVRELKWIHLQLQQAGGGMTYETTIYTSGSGNYTVPANCDYVILTVCGGGGGGGGSAGGAAGTGAGGGGSGDYSVAVQYNVTAGDSLAYSIGAKGTGATAGDNDGNNGGDTSFGSVTWYGGRGGKRGSVHTGGAGGNSLTAGGGSGSVGTRGAVLGIANAGSGGGGGSASTTAGGDGGPAETRPGGTGGTGNASGGGGGGGASTAMAQGANGGNGTASPTAGNSVGASSYGAGGGGAGGNTAGGNRAGGDGGPGVLIIHAFIRS